VYRLFIANSATSLDVCCARPIDPSKSSSKQQARAGIVSQAAANNTPAAAPSNSCIKDPQRPTDHALLENEFCGMRELLDVWMTGEGETKLLPTEQTTGHRSYVAIDIINEPIG
jgi:hypothetical protein